MVRLTLCRSGWIDSTAACSVRRQTRERERGVNRPGSVRKCSDSLIVDLDLYSVGCRDNEDGCEPPEARQQKREGEDTGTCRPANRDTKRDRSFILIRYTHLALVVGVSTSQFRLDRIKDRGQDDGSSNSSYQLPAT